MSRATWERRKDIFLGSILTAGVGILGYLALNVAELNQNLAIVIERQDWHYKQIQENKLAIKKLQGGKYE